MTNALVVVAPYDDHFLWMGATIARMQARAWNWTVVVMVDQGPIKRDLFERCCQSQSVHSAYLDFVDYQGGGVFSVNNQGRMTQSLLSTVASTDFDWAFTHTGARGALIVTPLGLQEGANKVGQAANVVSVTLNADCTPTEFVMAFLDKVFLGVSDTCVVSDHVKVEVVRGS
jgi:hypothetical protein